MEELQQAAGRGGPERVTSGVHRLDFILMGGFLRGSTYVVQGPPGVGKTVLGNQVAFHHVRSGGRALYLTLLAESHGRIVENLRTLAFYREEALQGPLRYVSGYGVLEAEGLAGLLKRVRTEVQQAGATLLVVDGLDAAGEFAPSALSFKRFLHELQAFTSMLGCTSLLLAARGPEAEHPENTTADGILELSHRMVGPRGVRELAVLKLRGSNFLLGRHEVEIDARGIVVHPRTEVQFGTPGEVAREDRIRMAFGIPRLDAALWGGLLSGSATTLLGAPGTGKTLLGLKFLEEGALQGQPGVYFGFHETPPRLLEKAEAVGIHLGPHVQSGRLEIQWQPPLETNVDGLAERLLERIHERGVRSQRLRVFVDGVGGFRAAAVYPDRLGRFLSALTHQLRILDVTTLISEETALFRPDITLPHEELGGAVENVLFLRNVELRSQLRRLISVLKMRESAYDSALREFHISEQGIEVAESFASAEAVLSGSARLSGPSAPARPQRKRGGAARKASSSSGKARPTGGTSRRGSGRRK